MDNKNLFLIYLGRSGAGPKITLDFTKEIIKSNEIENFNLLISSNNLIKEDILNLKENTYTLNTPISNIESIWRLPKFIIGFIKILLRNRNKNNNFLFFMTHVWNPISMILIKIFIPKSNIYFVVHDGKIHPGDSKLQYYIMQTEIFLSKNIITLTNNVKEIISKKWKKKKIIVLEHPTYDFGKIERVRELNTIPTFLFFGRIVKYKGLLLFLKAIEIFDKKMKELNKNYKVIIAGEGKIEKEEAELINKINQDKNNIEILNRYIDEKEIAQIWDRSDICILPYIEASQSGVVAIAINKAMPCIITPMKGLLEQCVNQDNKSFALITKDLSPTSLSTEMINILEEDKYKELSQNAINIQEKYGWDKWVKEVSKK